MFGATKLLLFPFLSKKRWHLKSFSFFSALFLFFITNFASIFDENTHLLIK